MTYRPSPVVFHSILLGGFLFASPVFGLNIPFTDDFESGLDNWVLSGDGTTRTELTSEFEPRSGSRHVLLSSSAEQSNARNELTVVADLAGERYVKLSFWAKELNDEIHASPPSPFQGGADFDGVSISPDGINWYTIFEFPAGFLEYTQFVINLDAEVAQRGLAYTSEFHIRISQFDDSTAPNDGILIDDFSLGDVTIPGVAVLPLVETFEEPLADYWTVTGVGPARGQVTSALEPQEGNQHFVMDSSESGVDALNELTLTVDLRFEERVTLEFWAKEFNDERQTPPQAFVEHYNYDGIAISTADGIWYSIFSFPVSFPAYTKFTVDIDAALEQYGLDDSDRILIRFNQFDNNEADSDGIAIDNIVLFSDRDPEMTVELPSGNPLISGQSTIRFPDAGTNASETIDLVVYNTGVSDLGGFNFDVSGENAGDFTVSRLPDPIPPGGNGILTVQFLPTTLGPRTATCTVTSNDPDTSPILFNLEGNGIQPEEFAILLPAAGEQASLSNEAVRAQARTVQFVYGESILEDLPAGSTITSMAFRLNGGAINNWPATDLSWANYDVQLSTSNYPPGQLNDFFGENVGDNAVFVRSGPLTINRNGFSGGSNPNAFGSQIAFTTPFVYPGGPLLVTIRHDGNGDSQALLDAAPDNIGVVQGIWSHDSNAYTAATRTSSGRTPVAIFSFYPPSGDRYEPWKEDSFEPSQLNDPLISGPAADPDRDHIPNLLEYIFGLDALQTEPQPWRPLLVEENGNSYFGITFILPEDFAEDAILIVEESEDLGATDPWAQIATKHTSNGWLAIGGSIRQSPAVDGKITVTVRSGTPVNDPDQSSFLRLRAQIP